MARTRFTATLVIYCLVCLAALSPRRGDASLVLALDTNALAQRADHIAVTDVVSVKSAWDQAHKKIITTIDLSVVESWKGGAQPASHITVMQPGGTVGDVAMVVFGLSHFTPGERTLVFLRGTAAAAGVVGMAQGKLPMLRDAATGKWTVGVADRAGLERVPANRNASVAPASAEGPRSLEEMRGHIQQILKAAP
jgi:hypothetical protein